jgi:hypothetical protein
VYDVILAKSAPLNQERHCGLAEDRSRSEKIGLWIEASSNHEEDEPSCYMGACRVYRLIRVEMTPLIACSLRFRFTACRSPSRHFQSYPVGQWLDDADLP